MITARRRIKCNGETSEQIIRSLYRVKRMVLWRSPTKLAESRGKYGRLRRTFKSIRESQHSSRSTLFGCWWSLEELHCIDNKPRELEADRSVGVLVLLDGATFFILVRADTNQFIRYMLSHESAEPEKKLLNDKRGCVIL